MSAPIRTFRNVRARLHRRSSDETYSGWVIQLVREEARIRLWQEVEFEFDETVSAECFGHGAVARLTGRILAQAGQEIAIQINGSISYAPSDETPRIYAIGLSGKLTGKQKSASMRVLDVSPLSLGIVADKEFETGERMTMSLPTEMGPVTAEVSVANCRQDGDRNEYRIGLHITEMARLDQARWSRLVAERAEA